MASIGSPIAGPIININARTVSRSVISGGGGGAAGDPETSSIVKRQTTDITLINKNIGVLAKRQSDAIASFQQAIGTLTQGLNTIRVTVQDLGNKLNVTNNLLAADTKLEQQQDLQEQKQEKVLAEQGARAGKESLLERKIQSALLAPVRFVAAQTQSILERLKSFFTTLLLGWLTNQLIETLKANAEGNKTKLQQIFDAVTVALSTTFKGLSLIARTFSFITKVIFGVTKVVAKLTAGIIEGLFKGVKNLGKFVADGAKGLLGIGAKPAAKAGTEAAVKATEKAVGKEAIKGTIGKIPVGSLLTGAAFGGMRLMEGDVTGAGMEAASAISATLPGWGTALSYTIDAAIINRDFGGFKGTAFEKKEPGAKPTKPAAKTKPANAKKPSASTLKMPTSASQSATTDTAASETTSTPQLQATPAQTQSLQTSLSNIGPAPQAQPNVVMMSSMAGGQPQEPQMTSSGGAASDVPAISSSNPSNFYTLYSQVNYNVVM
jgi:hypothetical protein